MTDAPSLAAERARWIADSLLRQRTRGRDGGEVTLGIQKAADDAGLSYRELLDLVHAARQRWVSAQPTDHYAVDDRVIDSRGVEYLVASTPSGDDGWMQIVRLADRRELWWFPGPRLRLLRRAGTEDSTLRAADDQFVAALWRAARRSIENAQSRRTS